MHSSICRKDFPALDGPARSILWPLRRTPSIRQGDSSGRLSQTSASGSGSGRSSLTLSIHSCHSLHDALPMLVSIRNCFLPPLTTPGMRDSREGLRFCLSIFRPFLSHTSYR